MPGQDKVLAAKVAASVVVYCLAVSAVPIYNKKVFSGKVCWDEGACAKSFPYPIATAFLQLGFVSLVLGFASVVGHLCSPQARAAGRSWVFGPHFGYKLRHVAPVGLLFGVKYAITNWGLALVPTAKHLLLQSTDLVWTVIFARAINKERLGLFEGVAAVFSVVGGVLISLEAGGNLEAPVLGLTVNLLTPIFLALCITTLRKGVAELFRPDNCVGGMSPAEFTAIKLALSSAMALAISFLLENEGVLAAEGRKHPQSWWSALHEYPAVSLGLLFVGGLFVLVFQVNITWLSGLTSATAVGIVGEVKVVPQWFINAAFSAKLDLSPFNIAGALFSLAGSVLYASSASQPRRLILTRQGVQWVAREGSEPLKESLTPAHGVEVRTLESGQARGA
uniref:Sugar phosphate transporter domain-containing protein n=1 Tax=Alexandrium catenella TaxID=2925 RepID=A0A7S1RXV4_ALECA